MTKEEFKNGMEKIYDEFVNHPKQIWDGPATYIDAETLHIKLDELMCKCLEEAGYEEGVEVWKKAPKWFA